MGRTLIVGDIHGCYYTLERLLEKADYDPSDRLVFVGDYIDRGKHSAEVVDFILQLQQSNPNVYPLLGNHDLWMQGFIKSGYENYDQMSLWLTNGGRHTLESFTLPLRPEVENFFANLLSHYESDNFIVAHAGIDPGVPMADQSPHTLLWDRSFYQDDHYGGKPVIMGHTPTFLITGTDKVYHHNRQVVIDTGCVYAGSLTAYILPEEKVIQVKRRAEDAVAEYPDHFSRQP